MELKSLTKSSARIVKTTSSLGFLTLLIGLIAGNHTAIAQTIDASGRDRGSIDRTLVARQQLETPGSDNSKNFNLPNLIAGGDRHEDRRDLLEDRRDRLEDRREDRRDRHDGAHHQDKKKPDISGLNSPLTIKKLKMPNPIIIGGDGE